MHEGSLCREIMEVVGEAALIHNISKVYEIVLRVGPYSCIHEKQMNFYFEILGKGTCMEDAKIIIEKDESIKGISQMYIQTFRGE